jgi:hypothetical protein
MEFSADIQISPSKKSKNHKRTFSAVTMDFGTFSMPSVKFSTVKMGMFGGFVLILFYRYGGNPIRSGDFTVAACIHTYNIIPQL